MRSAIRLENIEKCLGDRKILKGISFSVETGDIFGYLGPNGAGKTTTIRIILGLFKADSGNLDVLGMDIENSEVRRKIGLALVIAILVIILQFRLTKEKVALSY